MTLRELIIEYILFAYEPHELAREFHVAPNELAGLADVDLLELYDQTLITPIQR
jgi:hypothetical protein